MLTPIFLALMGCANVSTFDTAVLQPETTIQDPVEPETDTITITEDLDQDGFTLDDQDCDDQDPNISPAEVAAEWSCYQGQLSAIGFNSAGSCFLSKLSDGSWGMEILEYTRNLVEEGTLQGFGHMQCPTEETIVVVAVGTVAVGTVAVGTTEHRYCYIQGSNDQDLDVFGTWFEETHPGYECFVAPTPIPFEGGDL